MLSQYFPAAFALAVGVVMIIAIVGGARLARARRAAGILEGDGASSIDGAMYGIFGLVLAFTFAGAAARLEARRELIRDETNAIGTVYLRLDLLPVTRQPALRTAFSRYVTARLAVFADRRNGSDTATAKAAVLALQGEIWTLSVAAAAEVPGPQAATLLLPARNEMFDITTTREVATQSHPPMVIFFLLGLLACATALNAGYAIGSKEGPASRLHIAGFVLAISLILFVTLDLELPRFGLIQISGADDILRELGAQFQH